MPNILHSLLPLTPQCVPSLPHPLFPFTHYAPAKPASLLLLENAGQSPPPSEPLQLLVPLLRSLFSTPSPSDSYMASFLLLLQTVHQMSTSRVGFPNPLYKRVALHCSPAPTFPSLYTIFYCLPNLSRPQFLVSFVSLIHLQNQEHSKHSNLSFETTIRKNIQLH